MSFVVHLECGCVWWSGLCHHAWHSGQLQPCDIGAVHVQVHLPGDRPDTPRTASFLPEMEPAMYAFILSWVVAIVLRVINNISEEQHGGPAHVEDGAGGRGRGGGVARGRGRGGGAAGDVVVVVALLELAHGIAASVKSHSRLPQ